MGQDICAWEVDDRDKTSRMLQRGKLGGHMMEERKCHVRRKEEVD